MTRRPQRIQRKRIKGWKAPEGAVYVGRPTHWGNPFTVINGGRQGWLVYDDRDRLGFVPFETSNGYIAAFDTRNEAHGFAVERYCAHVRSQMALTPPWDLALLRGRDLMCFCPLDRPCHADILLEIANA